MMPSRRSDSPGPPPLGDEIFIADRTCMRLMGTTFDGAENLCGKPAVKHVDWGEASGFICHEHLGDLERWDYHDAHDLGGNCGMPGTMWYWAIWDGKRTSWCGVPGDGPPTEEPVRAVAQEVDRVA